MPITSAYNFVPLASKVVCPDWAPQVSHDLPLPEGVCAEIRVRWTNHTPLLVGSGLDGQDLNRDGVQCVRPFQHPDGIHALPGSSLRGMLRNVIEIASFSRMNLVDDTDLSIRDFTSIENDYMQRLVTDGASDPKVGAGPKAHSAWLWLDGMDWRIKKVESCRVQQSDLLQAYFKHNPSLWRTDDPEWRPSAREKYEALWSCPTAAGQRGLLRCWYKVDRSQTIREHPPKGNRKKSIYLRYRLVTMLWPSLHSTGEPPIPGATAGVLVVTGQPGPSKHMEFVFEPPPDREANSLVVDKAVFNRFQRVHGSPDGDWKSLWEARALRGEAVPVFVLHDPKTAKISNIGLAQMMRLPGEHSVGQMLQAHYKEVEGLDFATTLFGRVADSPNDTLRSRVAFGDARLTSRLEANVPAPSVTVLGQPKPGFYPNYLVQDQVNGKLTSNTYNTMLSSSPRLRGWKRYPVRKKKEVAVVVPPHDASAKLKVELHPLGQANFESTIRLHNVKPQELGAVLWALTWGGGSHLHLRHALGMGKSFGYGQVQATVIVLDVRPNARPGGQRNGADDRPLNARVGDYIDNFTGFMSDQVPEWKSCAEMKELLAMANPDLPQAKKSNLKPLTLTVGPNNTNEFTEAKKGGWVLPPYSALGKKP